MNCRQVGKKAERMCGKKKRVLALGMALSMGILVIGCSDGETVFDRMDSEKTESGIEEMEEQLNVLKSFTAETLDGDAFTQDDITNKDATIINFWGTTCSPCIEEMPDIAEFAKSLPDNVQVLTVCLDGKYDMETAKDILSEAGYEGITLISGDGDLGRVCSAVRYTPMTIVVDGEGNIVGDALIGMQEDVATVYTDMINEVLKSSGKAELGNEEAGE